MSKRKAELFFNPYNIPREILSQIVNCLPLDAIEERFNLLRCSKEMATILKPSIDELIRWIQLHVIPGALNAAQQAFATSGSLFLAQLTKYLSGRHKKYYCFIKDLTTTGSTNAIKVFSCFHYISMLYTHAINLNLIENYYEHFYSNQPIQATRLKNIHVQNGLSSKPLLQCDILVASKLPDNRKDQLKAIERAIEKEKDVDVKELMASYDRNHSDKGLSLPAKCYVLTKKKRKLRAPKPEDLYGAVVYKNYHIYHPENALLRDRCFVFTGHHVNFAWRLLELKESVLDKFIVDLCLPH
jgi:hypothetical protein